MSEAHPSSEKKGRKKVQAPTITCVESNRILPEAGRYVAQIDSRSRFLLIRDNIGILGQHGRKLSHIKIIRGHLSSREHHRPSSWITYK